MDIEFTLNDALNKAICQKSRIQNPNSNTIAEFVSKYLQTKEIDYVRCCETLKDKELITFEKWLKFETIEIDSDNIWINGVAFNEDETLLEVYNEMK